MQGYQVTFMHQQQQHLLVHIYGSTGAVVTVGGPFLPLATQDLGVKQIDSYAITTGLTTGVGAFIFIVQLLQYH